MKSSMACSLLFCMYFKLPLLTKLSDSITDFFVVKKQFEHALIWTCTKLSNATQQTWNDEPMLVKCWSSTALVKHYTTSGWLFCVCCVKVSGWAVNDLENRHTWHKISVISFLWMFDVYMHVYVLEFDIFKKNVILFFFQHAVEW